MVVVKLSANGMVGTMVAWQLKISLKMLCGVMLQRSVSKIDYGNSSYAVVI